jgi:AraC-like DNA-binding protein
MVSNCCKLVVKSELEKLGLKDFEVDLGSIDIFEELSNEKKKQLIEALRSWGFELLNDNNLILVEKIKNAVIEMVHFSESHLKSNFSEYLSNKLNRDYTYLSNVFSENQKTTIAHFLLMHKIERAKELLIYDELNISEIAYMLHFSSVSHLSNQFKKMTGLSPSQYKSLKYRGRNPLETL